MNEYVLEKLFERGTIAVRKSWILLIVLIVIQMPLELITTENKWLHFAELLLIYGLLFSWYFICNKAWVSVLKIFGLIGVMLIMYNPLSYLMTSKQLQAVERIWVYELVSISFAIIATFLIVRLYLREESIVLTKRKQLKAVLLLGMLFFTIPKDSLINESFSVFKIETINMLFTGTLKVMYSISLLFIVYYILKIIKHSGSLFTIPKTDLALFSKEFFKIFAVLYLPLFIVFSILSTELFLDSTILVYQSFSIVTLLAYSAQIALFTILILIVGQGLRYKAIQEQSYYGVCGILLFIPIVNILFYLLIGLNEHHLILGISKPYSKKHWHVLAVLCLLFAVYLLMMPSGDSDMFLLYILIVVLYLLVSVINIGKMWQVALVFTIISLSLIGFIDYVVRSILVLVSSPSPSLLTFENLHLMSLLLTCYYAIIYSVRHVFLYEEDWETETD